MCACVQVSHLSDCARCSQLATPSLASYSPDRAQPDLTRQQSHAAGVGDTERVEPLPGRAGSDGATHAQPPRRTPCTAY